MKPGKLIFGISLAAIMLISWADIRFFGFGKTYNLSPMVRQSAHYTIFFVTATIGYLNWRNRDKWIRWLWVALYGLVLLFTLIIGIAYNLSGHHLTLQWKTIMADVRLSFIGPVPFLVFSLLLRLTREMMPGSDAQKQP